MSGAFVTASSRNCVPSWSRHERGPGFVRSAHNCLAESERRLDNSGIPVSAEAYFDLRQRELIKYGGANFLQILSFAVCEDRARARCQRTASGL